MYVLRTQFYSKDLTTCDLQRGHFPSKYAQLDQTIIFLPRNKKNKPKSHSSSCRSLRIDRDLIRALSVTTSDGGCHPSEETNGDVVMAAGAGVL
ncbi:hypothetical protein TNIN_457331 [Trichonephila inaurata madagascariensis]|uniref:Uncharacterized protein n=1 Tax=Trichonephila inaurata madagascariensis TaxID=2747483 RepID=A0A8X6X371_9ARAC|nr:hypothetical protein TNIN_457331 [Trichonephila inaurata madagascariensis]